MFQLSSQCALFEAQLETKVSKKGLFFKREGASSLEMMANAILITTNVRSFCMQSFQKNCKYIHFELSTDCQAPFLNFSQGVGKAQPEFQVRLPKFCPLKIILFPLFLEFEGCSFIYKNFWESGNTCEPCYLMQQQQKTTNIILIYLGS